MDLTPAEKSLTATIGFEEDVSRLLKQRIGGELQRVFAMSEEAEPTEADGLSVAVPRQNVEPIIGSLQPELLPRGYRAFWSERRRPNGLKENDEIVVLKTVDSFEILRLRRPDGANYGVSTEDIVARLQQWKNRCQFTVFGAASAWVALEFQTLPEALGLFAEEIYDFCPDTVEQGVGLMHEAEDPDAFEAARRLYPELSPPMQEKLTQQKSQFAEMDVPEELRRLMESAAGFSTPTDMGIRLLAYELQQSQQLFLWWD